MALTRINNQALTNVTSAGIPKGAGQVLQVKRGVLTSPYNTTGSYADTGLEVSITPTSSSSTIYIVCHCNVYAAANKGLGVRFARGSTSIYDPSAAHTNGNPYLYYHADAGGYSNLSFDYIDSPATTSAITYKVQARYYNGTTARLNTDDGTDASSSITVMEIAG